MNKQLLRRAVACLLVLCLVLPFIPAAGAASVKWKKTDLRISPELFGRPVREEPEQDRDPNELVRVSIVLEEPSTVEAGYSTMDIAADAGAMDYRARLQRSQERMEKTISARVLGGRPLDVVWNMTLVGNIISAWVPYGRIGDIEALPGVRTVAMEAQYEPAQAQRGAGAVPNAYSSSAMTGTGTLWSGGYTGAGSRIAIIDTGTDTDHQSFDNGAYLYALEQTAAEKGMTREDYLQSLDLLDLEELRRVLPELNLHALDPSVQAEQLYGNEKLPFGYNYVDNNRNIVHDYDQQGEHGSHVAGIAAANRYIPTGSGYADAREAVLMQGAAPDAQVITMKVFGEQAPFDSDYMAAIEDAILLGCDVVNLSLGSTAPGSPYTDVYSELMEMMTRTDTVVAISAGNAANWAQTTGFGYLYHDDVSFNEVGAPGSYGSAFTVASVDNSGTVGHYFTAAGQQCFYAETEGYGNAPMAELDFNGNGTEYEYVFLDGLGYPEEYEGIRVAGKVVFISRGVLSFVEKANTALGLGAAAVVIYNNEPSVNYMDLTGLSTYAPVVSITQAEAAAIREASEDRGSYRSGRMTVYAAPGLGVFGGEYMTMSDFSSWGVPGDLSLKPEITAPGGSIYSVWGSNAVNGGGSDQYELMSGTSMAAPQVAGMAALLAQVYRENGLAQRSGLSARHLAQSLLMSTAQPLYEEASGGNYYSLLNQGAGLARVDLAAQAESYVLVSGQPDGKVKAELGDDPRRTGVYTFDFTITNMTGKPAVYTLDAELFRQDVFEYQPGSGVWLLDTWTTALEGYAVFTSEAMGASGAAGHDLNGDGITNAADADFLLECLLGNEPALLANGDLSGDGMVDSYDAHLLLQSLSGDTVTVPAYGTVTVGVELKLSEEARRELDAQTPKGTYVQAFVYARSEADAEGSMGTTHSIPVLAFYGDWSEPSMFDRGNLLELVYNQAERMPYLYYYIGNYGNALGIDYGDGTEYYYGGNPVVDDETYLPERNAFNSQDGSRLTEQTFTLIRGAGEGRVQISNADTGEVYFERLLGELYPAFYNPGYGSWENTIQYAGLNWTGTDAAGVPVAEGTKVAVSLTAVPHYYRRADGSYPFDGLGEGSTMTTTMTIDNTAPEIVSVDDSRAAERKLTVRAKDGEFVAAVALLNANGTKALTIQTPNQTRRGQEITAELDLSGIYGKKFLVAVYDYAMNYAVYELELDLGSPKREYFTAIDTKSMSYVSVDLSGQVSEITDTGLPVLARAAEYVGGYVFIITGDNSLCVANDTDLTVTERICQLDPEGALGITGFNDLAYNHADGTLYGQFYSWLNGEARPYLCSIGMDDGTLEVICELPVDVNTMAIDTQGNFYSAGYGDSRLYTYTLADVTGETPTMRHVGSMGYYTSTNLSSMAWDHNTGTLYWAYPNTLLRINHQTAEPELLGYHTQMLVGLYTRPEVSEGRFDPVDTVDRVALSCTETRVVVGRTTAIEANVWPWNASDRTVSWSSSDPSVATVDDKGIVTGQGLGSCVITAVSNLDRSVSASCTVTTFELEKTLQGIVWDENGEIWMSEFSVSTLPEYTKLSGKSLGRDLASATRGQDGSIYAASLDMATLRSSLYKLDPVTYQPTLVGASTDGYVDLAPAPGQPGNSLMAVYGGNVMQVDAETGDYYNYYYMFSYNLVALAYVGTEAYQQWGFDTLVDWYFLIDRVGNVYLMGFMEQDDVYYYIEHDRLAPGGLYTTLDFEMDTPYFGSAYFDGEMLYFSAYKESRSNVTLMAIDVAGGSKTCYELGTFADNVWPVAGLMEPGTLGGNADILATNAKPVQAAQTELKGIREDRAEGSLTAAAAPMSRAEVREELVFVDITLPAAGPNAEMTVTFNSSLLELTDVSGLTTAFAWKTGEGRVELALAEGAALAEQTAVARLTFRVLGRGETDIAVVTHVLGDQKTELTERVTLVLDYEEPHEHSYTAVVTEPTCTEGGFTTYTCACGDSYTADETAALGHDWQGRVCARCGAEKAMFEDVAEGQFYYDSVIWAVENGITTGATETTFNPGGVCMRGHVVTFLWRAMGKPEPESTVNPFVDVKETDYFYKAVLWAYENGITTGVDATHFAPTGECNRAQVVTFLWRTMGSPDSQAEVSFTDVAPGQFYSIPVAWAVEKGITNGMGDGTFGVMVTCNRAQVVTFLYRTLA